MTVTRNTAASKWSSVLVMPLRSCQTIVINIFSVSVPANHQCKSYVNRLIGDDVTAIPLKQIADTKKVVLRNWESAFRVIAIRIKK